MDSLSLVSRDIARKSARALLPGPIFRAGAALYNKRCMKQRVQPEKYEQFSALFFGDVKEDGSVLEFNISGMQHPLYARAGTPDAVEINHSIIREAYGKYLPEGEIGFVVDAGAYIGDTAAWYLSKFPGCQVVALEPAPETFAVLERNCSRYGERVRMINGALWWRDDTLDIVLNPETPTGISVAETAPSGAMRCQAYSLQTILGEAGADTLDILKLDIEGAELGLFSHDPDLWLSCTRSITMEIHSPEAYVAVETATRRHGFVRHRYRELFIYMK